MLEAPESTGRMLLVPATLVFLAAILLTAAWLGVAHLVMPEGGRLRSMERAYVEAWGQAPYKESFNSVRIGGIGERSFGRELSVKVMARDGRRVLDALTWKIDAEVSPDLSFASPLPPDSIGAVLIAIE